jgi:hypothetical protein
VVQQYIDEQYMIREIDHINYLDEAPLLELAQESNVKAMYILGVNYRWHATMENFRAENVRPPELDKPVYKQRKTPNLTIMNKARHWLNLAALNGQTIALRELAVSYDQLAYNMNELDNPDKNEIERLNLIAMAYRALHDELVPQLADNDEVIELSTEQQVIYRPLYQFVKTRWADQRELLGLPFTVDLNIPIEVTQLNDLQQQLCEAQ